MHEWALAEAVVSTALRVLKEKGLEKVSKITVKIGRLQQVEIDLFEFALKEIKRTHGPIIENATIEIETENAVLRCRACQQQWLFEESLEKLKTEDAEAIHFIPEVAHVYIRCPKCNSPDFEVLKGRGVWIASIEGTKG
ncbi:MAG: hydrogenase nickel incorporation protein HypA [Promethearchaeota archaeon]